MRDPHQTRNKSGRVPAVRIERMHGAGASAMAGRFADITALRASGSPSFDCLYDTSPHSTGSFTQADSPRSGNTIASAEYLIRTN